MSTQLYMNGQDEMVVKSETEVQYTNNYRLFKMDARNRVVVPEHVDELARSIQQKNLLHLYPIIVDTSYTVIDGQHRLHAAEQLGVPIYYLVSQQITILDVPTITDKVKTWSSSDYLHYYCVQGKPEYIAVRELWRRFPFLTLNHVYQLSARQDITEMHQAFRAGTYVANTREFCVRVAEAVLDLKAYVDFYNHSPLVRALSNLLGNDEYRHERFMQKMKYLSRRLVKCPDAQSYIACINEIYNYKALPESRVELKRLNSHAKGFNKGRWDK